MGPVLATTDWMRRLREPALVFGLFLVAAWLPYPGSSWRLALQAVLGIAASIAIARNARRDRVALPELGLRADNLLVSSFVFLLITLLPLTVVHGLGGRPGLRPGDAMVYFGWALFQQFVVVAGFWRYFRPALTSWRRDLWAAALTAGLFALAHAPNLPLMAIVFVAELVWLLFFTRFRNLFALSLAHAVAAIVIKHDLVPVLLPSMKVGLGYWWP